jgi:hypothetical protein
MAMIFPVPTGMYSGSLLSSLLPLLQLSYYPQHPIAISSSSGSTTPQSHLRLFNHHPRLNKTEVLLDGGEEGKRGQQDVKGREGQDRRV